MANLTMTYNGQDIVSLTPGLSAITKTLECKDKMMSTNVVFKNAYDANLVAKNILNGRSVFGVSGDSSTLKTKTFSIETVSQYDSFDWATNSSDRTEAHGDKGYIKDISVSSLGFGTVSGWIWKGLSSVWTKRKGSVMNYYYNGHARQVGSAALTMTSTTVQIYQTRYNDGSEWQGEQRFQGNGIIWGY